LVDRWLRIRRGALVAALVVGIGCERGGEFRSGEPSVPAPAEREALAPGEARVAVKGGRVTVVCQAAPRGLVLEKLARQARFELSGELDAQPLTLDLESQPLESVIAALLADLPYRAQWRYDATGDRHELTRLEVGEVPAAPAAASGSADKAKRRELADALRGQLRELREKSSSEEQKAEIAARREEQVHSQADLLEQLRSSNPDMRIEAVEGLDPEGPALVAVLELLKSDPDPRVREKAAQQGGEADGFVACAALLDALGDPEPAVVLQALGSLEFTCDETVAPIVAQRCAQAMDPAVQARCAEALEFMQ